MNNWKKKERKEKKTERNEELVEYMRRDGERKATTDSSRSFVGFQLECWFKKKKKKKKERKRYIYVKYITNVKTGSQSLLIEKKKRGRGGVF